MSKKLLLLILLLMPLLVAAQPALVLGSSTVKPGESTTINVVYRGTGSGVTSFDGAIFYDQSLFSSAVIRCPVAPAGASLFCTRTDSGLLRIVVATDPATEIPTTTPIGIIELMADPSAPPGSTEIQVVAERYFDASGNSVPPSGSLDGSIGIQPPDVRPAIRRSRGVRGDALIFPYFIARDGQNTIIALVNTSPFAKALRVNVRESFNGRSLIGPDVAEGLNVYLNPRETRRLVLQPLADGGAVLNTSACTVPSIPDGLVLSPDAFVNDGGPTDVARTEEGFVTVLAMADLFGAAATDLANGNCDAIGARWQAGGVWAGNPTTDTSQPLGSIAGVASIRGLAGRLPFDFGATGLEGFANGNLHTAPQSVLDLNSGSKTANISGVSRDFNSGIEAVSSVLMATELTLPVRARGVEWIITFPTKRYFTDANLVFNPPINPFTSVFTTGGACETATLFPNTFMLMRDLCGHTNVLPFNGRRLLGSDSEVPSITFPADAMGRIQFTGSGLSDVGNAISLDGLPVLGMAIPYRPGANRRTDRIGLPAAVGAKGGTSNEAGAAVTVHGRLVFVGVPGADGGRGKVFVFRRHGTVLVLEATLEPPLGLSAVDFGKALAAADNLVLIGAPGDPGAGAKGPGGTMQAALFERLSGDWTIKESWESLTGNPTGFGTSVALDGTTVAIGAPADSTMGTGAGAVYLYDTDGFSVGTALPTSAGQFGGFGSSIDMKNGLLAAGSPNATIGSALSGSVSMFQLISGNVMSLDVLAPAAPNDGDAFGTAVSIGGTMVAVGAPGTNGGVAGEIDNNGAVGLWSFDGAGFNAAAQIQPEDAGFNGNFGFSLDFTDLGFVAGAPGALGAAGATGAIYEYEMVDEEIFLDGRSSSADPMVAGYGSSVASDGEIVVVGAPQSAAEAGAAIAVIDAEVLFFDSYETELF